MNRDSDEEHHKQELPPTKRQRYEKNDKHGNRISNNKPEKVNKNTTLLLADSHLMDAASFLGHKDRLSLAATCKMALQVVELLCKKKLEVLKVKHLQQGNADATPEQQNDVEAFEQRLRDTFLEKCNDLRRHGKICTTEWQIRRNQSLSWRCKLWVALYTPIYKVGADSFGGKIKYETRMPNHVYQIYPDDRPIFGICCGSAGGFGFWNMETRKSCGLVFEKNLEINEDDEQWFTNSLLINHGNHLLVVQEHNKKIFHLYSAKDNAGNRDGDIDGCKVTWDFQQTIEKKLRVLDCISTYDNKLCIYAREAEEKDVAEVGTLDACTGNLEPMFVINAREELQCGVGRAELALCNHQWLLVRIGRGIVVYDLVKKQKVHSIKGYFEKLSVNPSQLSTIYCLTSTGHGPRVGCLEMNGESGHIRLVSSFDIGSSPIIYHISVDFELDYVIVCLPSDFLVYNGKTGELLRKVKCPNYNSGYNVFRAALICTRTKEILASPSAEMPYVFCLDEPWI
mmetsp:Transcript_17215/g.30988  ORF Transcript_17215/g.30988 Transcript_17215/m.30988 type:complete len:511 (+) Transcript_17215:1-1533(+)